MCVCVCVCVCILPQIVQHAGPALATLRLSLVQEMWKEGSVSQAWGNTELVLIPGQERFLTGNFH